MLNEVKHLKTKCKSNAHLSERSEDSRRAKMMNNQYYVYIMTNKNNTVLYTGVTNNLERRLYEHKNKLIDGFTKKYNINKLVYYETTNDINTAIEREKQIKGWLRIKKIQLIENTNPEWNDLSEEWERDSSSLRVSE